MKNTAIFFALLLLSCNQQAGIQKKAQQNQSDTETSIDSLAKSLNLKFSDFQQIDNSPYVLFPLSISVEEEDNSKFGSYLDYDNYKQRDGGYLRYWNIGFYNTDTKAFHLLSDSLKMIIYSFQTSLSQNDEESEYYNPDFLYFSVTTLDFNKDDALNKDDPTYLFLSDRYGRNFRQISPDYYHVQDWKVFENGSKIIMMTLEDTNGDKIFDDEDDQVPFVFDLIKSKKAEKVLEINTMEQIKTLFLKNWQTQQH